MVNERHHSVADNNESTGYESVEKQYVPHLFNK
jgi:hypothetical protein